jgi:hypothetical protein
MMNIFNLSPFSNRTVLNPYSSRNRAVEMPAMPSPPPTAAPAITQLAPNMKSRFEVVIEIFAP